jgi:hypothetical protein
MRAVIVFESAFGNTEQVARSVSIGMARVEGVTVDVVEVGSAGHPLVHAAHLLVVGGPTHAFGMSNLRTRHEARAEGGTSGSAVTGIREWIADLPLDNRPVATFDTKVRSVRWLRGAAKEAMTQLRRRGYRPIAGASSFYVGGPAGPLVEGERTRAEAWGKNLARLAVMSAALSTGPRSTSTNALD